MINSIIKFVARTAFIIMLSFCILSKSSMFVVPMAVSFMLMKNVEDALNGNS